MRPNRHVWRDFGRRPGFEHCTAMSVAVGRVYWSWRHGAALASVDSSRQRLSRGGDALRRGGSVTGRQPRPCWRLLAAAGGGIWWWCRTATRRTIAKASCCTRSPASDFELTVTERGEIEAFDVTEVRSLVKSNNTTGNAILRIVPEGTVVKKGDFLVELDSSALKAAAHDAEDPGERRQGRSRSKRTTTTTRP